MGISPSSARAAKDHVHVVAAVLVDGLIAGCSAVPNQKELSLLEEQRQAMEAAEDKVAEGKAEKARLESELADAKAELKALDEKKAATEANLSNRMSE